MMMDDDAYFNMTRLQDLACFYREPTGYGSQGGYDCLFGGIPVTQAPTSFSEEEKEIWRWHWNTCNAFPDAVKTAIISDISIKDLIGYPGVPADYHVKLKDGAA